MSQGSGYHIANAYFTLIPSTQGIGDAIRAELEEAYAAVNAPTPKMPEVPPPTDIENRTQAFRDAGVKLQDFGNKTTDIGKKTSMYVSGPLAAAGVGILALGRNHANTANDILNMSLITGVSVENLQALNFWATQNNVSQGEMERALERLTGRIFQAQEEGSKYHDALLNLGFSTDELTSGTLDTEEVFLRAADSISQVEDETERTRMAQELFGERLGRKLIPALSQGSEGFHEAYQELDGLNGIMSEDSLVAANEFGNEMGKLQAAMGGVMATVISDLLPVLQDHFIPFMEDIGIPVLQNIGEAIGAVAQWFSGLPEPVQKVILSIAGIAAVAGPVLIIVGKMATGIGAIIKVGAPLLAMFTKIPALLAPIGTAIMSVVKIGGTLLAGIGLWPIVIAAAVVAIGVLIWNFRDEIGEALTAAWEWVKDYTSEAWNNTKDTISYVWESIKSGVKDAAISVATGLLKIWDGIKDGASKAWNATGGLTIRVVQHLRDKVVDLIGNLRDKAVDITGRARDGIVNGWNRIRDGVVNAVSRLRDGAVNGFNRLMDFVRNIPKRIMGVFSNVGNMLKNAGKSLINGFTNGITSAFGKARDAVSRGMKVIRDFFPFSPAKTGPFSGRGYSSYSGRALIGDLGKGIESQIPALRNAADNAAHAASDSLSNMAAVIPDYVPEEWSAQLTPELVGANAAAGYADTAANEPSSQGDTHVTLEMAGAMIGDREVAQFLARAMAEELSKLDRRDERGDG